MKIDWRKYPDGGIYAYVSDPEAISLDICCGLNGFWTARAFQGGLKVHEDGGYTSKYRARIALQ
jgi:hypothetical protein